MQTTIAPCVDLEKSTHDRAAERFSYAKPIRCDCCHKAIDDVVGFAYLTPNDFIICNICAESETWQKEELWLVRHIHEL